MKLKIIYQEPAFPKPKRPYFAAGPCVKPQGWDVDHLRGALIARSHRSKEALRMVEETTSLMRQVLDIPSNFYLAFMPGSTTGAIESLIWNLLGERPVDIVAQDVFSLRWAQDVQEELKLTNSNLFTAPVGEMADLRAVNFDHDVLINWNGSTSGVCFPQKILPLKRDGLVIADVTSAVFTMPIPFEQLDAFGFSFQKGLGGEAGMGVIAVNDRVINRLNSYTPSWPIPYVFKLTSKGQFYQDLFQGKTLNTFSLLVLEDFYQALKWAKGKGSGPFLYKKTQDNAALVDGWVNQNVWIDYVAKDPALRSNSTVCLKIVEPQVQALSVPKQWEFLEIMAQMLSSKSIAFDILNHKGSIPSLRLWCGPTMEGEDLQALFPWLEWAYGQALKELNTL